MDDLVKRAMAAYFRAGASNGEQRMQPSNTSAVMEHDGHRYVVLRNMGGVLAVYRVRNDGMLKGLKRWPAALEGGATREEAVAWEAQRAELVAAMDAVAISGEPDAKAKVRVMKSMLKSLDDLYSIEQEVRHGVREGWIPKGSDLHLFTGGE